MPLNEVDEIIRFEEILREATRTAEDELALEDRGWVNLSTASQEIITATTRIAYVRQSRLYWMKDPLAKQAIRLWTDYTFGEGMTFKAKDEAADKALRAFWDNKMNKSVLSARGQRISSDKLLVDGEIFFAVFLGPSGAATIRRINPLEITEIITDPDDIENVYFYKREWSNAQGFPQKAMYRSSTNKENKPMKDGANQEVTATDDDVLVYHLAYNTITQRGYPLLLPALDWIKEYRRFLASRIAIMLALAKFAWYGKVAGGSAAVDSVKAALEGQAPAAASTLYTNQGADFSAMKVDSKANNAYQDARMLRLQICAAVGIPEQYYGDISTGNLATAKTVELPLMKMFKSYQLFWGSGYEDLDEIVLAHNGISESNWYTDRDFPPIAPHDAAAGAEALVKVIGVMPDFAFAPEVQQLALMLLGINDAAEVLAAMENAIESGGNVDAKLAKVLREVARSLNKNGHS